MNSRKLTNILTADVKLRAIFSGMVFCAASLLTIIITAGVWYF